MTFTAVCRSCGDEQQVRVLRRSTVSAGGFGPDYCRSCQSTDLVLLRDLSRAELEEIEQAIKEREGGRA